MTKIHKLKISEKLKNIRLKVFPVTNLFSLRWVFLLHVHTHQKSAWNHIKLHQSPLFLLFLYYFLANIKKFMYTRIIKMLYLKRNILTLKNVKALNWNWWHGKIGHASIHLCVWMSHRNFIRELNKWCDLIAWLFSA